MVIVLITFTFMLDIVRKRGGSKEIQNVKEAYLVSYFVYRPFVILLVWIILVNARRNLCH